MSRQQTAQPSSSDAVARREALEELIRSDGWRIFVSHFVNEWQGAGYVSRMRGALATNDILEPKIVDRVAIEFSRLLQWPGDQVRELKGVADE